MKMKMELRVATIHLAQVSFSTPGSGIGNGGALSVSALSSLLYYTGGKVAFRMPYFEHDS